jgi:LPS sulfotransferase NodH
MQSANALATEAAKVRQDMSPERDFPAAECRFKYLICSTPRCGSTLLCGALASTGRAGWPAEYLTPPYRKAFLERIGADLSVWTKERWLSSGDAEYWQFLLKHRTSPNGVFGMKIHFDQMQANFHDPAAMRAFLAQFDHFVFLTRRDRLAQAVSFHKARATGVYRVAPDETVERVPAVPYSFRRIVHALNLIVARENRWRLLLGDFRDRTTSLTYEELAEDYVGSVRKALTAARTRRCGSARRSPAVGAQASRPDQFQLGAALHAGSSRIESTRHQLLPTRPYSAARPLPGFGAPKRSDAPGY